MLPKNYKNIGTILIGISFIATVIATFYKDLYIFGINHFFIQKGDYYILPIQIFLGQFIHGGLLHLVANSVFLVLFAPTIEDMVGRYKFLGFFIFTSIFTSLGLLILGGPNSNTIGISGFCMAILAYYTLRLWEINHPDYKGGITAIIVMIIIGIGTQISFLGHLFGAISGVLFYIFMRLFSR